MISIFILVLLIIFIILILKKGEFVDNITQYDGDKGYFQNIFQKDYHY